MPVYGLIPLMLLERWVLCSKNGKNGRRTDTSFPAGVVLFPAMMRRHFGFADSFCAYTASTLSCVQRPLLKQAEWMLSSLTQVYKQKYSLFNTHQKEGKEIYHPNQF